VKWLFYPLNRKAQLVTDARCTTHLLHRQPVTTQPSQITSTSASSTWNLTRLQQQSDWFSRRSWLRQESSRLKKLSALIRTEMTD